MKIVNLTAKKGEDLAVGFLRKKGYKIIGRNFRKGYGEIDIIAIEALGKERTLIFVEVKTRLSTQFGSPLEAITHWKIKHLVRTAQFYKMTHPQLPDSLRIDAVSVVLSNGQVKNIEHIKNINS